MKNYCNFIGRVGNDPEIKTMQSGDKVATFSIALTERWKDKNSGDRKEKTEWVRCVSFNQHLVKVIENYVKKGSLIDFTGQVQTRSYEKDGHTVYVTEFVQTAFRGEIILLDSKGGDAPTKEEPKQAPKSSGYGPADIDADQIPFAPLRKNEMGW